MDNQGKEGSFRPIIIVMLISLVIAGLWDKIPVIKNSIHAILNPSAGALLLWDVSWGMTFIILIITLIVTLAQKYATDQVALKELKKEQKEIQKQMKEFKEHPEKLMELQKSQFKLFPKQMKLSMRAIAFTGVPLILFFRWFQDFFVNLGDVKFFGIIGSWILFYFIIAIIFGAILRKYLKVV
ncbi:DUF106 domain-containing protein [Candidatus Pacearchaeota archaeon]|nr:DUF106 domain-containing protein [Candidatus Pacearchaeota archaeon]